MFRTFMNLIVTSMLFFPSKDFYVQPVDFGLIPEDVWCETSDQISIHGWYFKASESSTKCILYFHGNAGNISNRIPKITGWLKRNVSVMLVDYRGYGQSKGTIKKGEDLVLDAKAALSWLQKKYPVSNTIVYGESIGSVPAIYLGTEQKFLAVILEAPFTSLKELAKIHYGLAPDFLFQDFKFENENLISQIKCPVLIIHGEKDEIVPFQMGKRLLEKAPFPKNFLAVSGGHHNDLLEVADKDFFEKPFQFITELASEPSV